MALLVDYLGTLAEGLAYVVLGFVLLLVAKISKDVLTPFRLDDHLTGRDNPALGLAVTGYYAGVLIIFLGAIIGPELAEDPSATQFARELLVDVGYALGGIVALHVGSWVVDRLVLYKFSTRKEILEDRNVGTGAVECGSLVATGLIVAGAIHGEQGGVVSSLVFFVLGQVVLVLFTLFYQRITRYDVHDEIEKDNVAAGVALGASMIAIGIVLLKAVAGDLFVWSEKLVDFLYYSVLGFVLLLAFRKITDLVLLPGRTLGQEIAEDRNLNAAWLEGVVAMGMASVIFFTI
jgi:uncharacterized membrane protein YjfL (UPF0719 family)